MSAMVDEEQLPRPAPDVTEAGIPAVDEVPEEMVLTGDTMEGEMPPLEHPQGVEEYGTTALEERQPESLEDRLAREQPEVGGGVDAALGPVAQPDAGYAMLDPDSDLVGDEETGLDDTPAPEEAALRATEDLPGATDNADPGYLEES